MNENQKMLIEVSHEKEEEVQKGIQRMREDETVYWDYPKFIADSLDFVAIKTLLIDRDVAKFKQLAYLIGKCIESIFFVEPLNTKESPHYVKPFSSISISARQHAFYWALISEQEALIESLAHLMGHKGEAWEVEQARKDMVYMGFAMKYLLLKEDDRAASYVKPLQKKKTLPKYWKAHLQILQGILEQDTEKAQAGLEEGIQRKPLTGEQYFYELLNVPLIGYGLLARRRGLDVSLDHPKAPQAVFEHHELEYPSTDFLFPEIQQMTWRDIVENAEK
ncbi:hypothetical protein GXN76_15110 [Kroppenstedtia pulmonis]|uniref:Uncharacterized protein n=1 Tax=Kroppenstedtia pulmonis TaxID=1380685 RepID=A0A7D3XK36_9BACL|nr:Imm49 family immunity protein [Kroppenstedtia pulmonis]QKG85644.1 hypothetical protein GXN76_15110 [Kroppenstedtia pulmonis]